MREEKLQKGRAFVKNALTMTVTSLVLRLLNIAFNVFLAARTGASGLGLFSLIMSVYGLAVTFATSGIGVAATRLMAEEVAAGTPVNARRAMNRCLLYSAALGAVACALLFFTAPFLGERWISDARAILPLRIMSFCMPFIALSSVMNGYFTAVRRVAKSSAALITEQVVRTALSFLFIVKYQNDTAAVCVSVAAASFIAEIIAFLLLGSLYAADMRKYVGYTGERRPIVRRILHISLPIAANAYLRSGISTVNQLMIPSGLVKYGYTTEDALAKYGMINAMVFPAIQLPQVLLFAFSGMLVPELAECAERGDTSRIHSVLELSLRLTMLFAAGVLCIYTCFCEEISALLYSGPGLTRTFIMLCPLVLVIYLDCVVDGVLSGLNQQVPSMLYNILESVMNTALIFFLLPVCGLYGYVCVLFAGKTLNMLLSLTRLIKVTGFTFRVVQWAAIPVLCAAATAGAIRLLKQFVPVYTAIVAAFFLLFLALKLSGALKRSDVRIIRLYIG